MCCVQPACYSSGWLYAAFCLSTLVLLCSIYPQMCVQCIRVHRRTVIMSYVKGYTVMQRSINIYKSITWENRILHWAYTVYGFFPSVYMRSNYYMSSIIKYLLLNFSLSVFPPSHVSLFQNLTMAPNLITQWLLALSVLLLPSSLLLLVLESISTWVSERLNFYFSQMFLSFTV